MPRHFGSCGAVATRTGRLAAGTCDNNIKRAEAVYAEPAEQLTRAQSVRYSSHPTKHDPQLRLTRIGSIKQSLPYTHEPTGGMWMTIKYNVHGW